MGFPDGYVLKLIKPLYGIPESGLHWYLTYLTNHLDVLNMKRSTSDLCLLFKRNGDKLDGLIFFQVDDSLGVGSESFLGKEENASKDFRCKPRTMITKDPISFNGIQITKKAGNIYQIAQPDEITDLVITTDQKVFAGQRASAQYVGVNTRPEICAAVQIIARGNSPTIKKEYKYLNKDITFLQDTGTKGLNYVPLDLASSRIVLLTDT